MSAAIPGVVRADNPQESLRSSSGLHGLNIMATPAPDPATAEILTSQASLPGWYGRISGLLAILLVVPIWAFENPPLVDYPNHLARGYVLYHYDDLPQYRENIEIDYLSAPSVSMDLFMVALQPICEMRLVGKLFLTLTLWLWFGGWHLLGCAIHGRPTWLALGAALVAYHSMFFYGFTNFSFSLGVFVVSLAAWLHGRSHWPWPRHLLIVALALACFFSHMAAFIFLAGSVLAITAWECFRARTISRAAMIDVLPVLVPLVFVLRGGGNSGFAWNSLQGKLIGSLSLLRGYNRFVDVAFLAAVGVFVLLLFLWSKRTQAVGSVLFTGLGCIAMFLIGPRVLFGGAPADARFLPVASALIFLSLDLAYPRKKALLLLGVFLALVGFRIGMIAYYWHGIDAELRDQVSLLAKLPEHASVYPIVKIPEQPEEQKLALPTFHAVCYAVIDRQAYVPTLLAVPGHIPMRYKTPPVTFHADAESFAALSAVDWDKVFTHYEYLWCCRIPDDYRLFLARHCTLIGEQGNGTLWRVTKGP
jgi:hypothetical protein